MADIYFPNISDDSIPDILKKTVGTLCECYYTSGSLTAANDYQTYFKVTYNETSPEDYDRLLSH